MSSITWPGANRGRVLRRAPGRGGGRFAAAALLLFLSTPAVAQLPGDMSITANGSTASWRAPGGAYSWIVTGTPDGATVTLEQSVNDADWAAVTGTAATAPVSLSVLLATSYLRVTTTGAGLSTDLTVALRRIPVGILDADAGGGGGGGATTLGDLTDVDETGATTGEALVNDGDGTWSPSLAPAMLTSTQAQDAQIVESNVTQHEAALSILEAQITDLAHTVDTDDQTAAEVPIVDAGALYVATEVEAALQETPPGARTPLAHAASHEDAGGDELALDASQVTTGTLVHERGGLEADVSAFGGLVRVAAGSTTAVTDLAGLNTALGSTLADGAHTTDTGPSPDCSGSLTYQDGEGNCDAYTLAGSTTELATVSGLTPTGECAEWDASGNLITSGAACGGGGTATALDFDGDGTLNVYQTGDIINFNPGDLGGLWTLRAGSFDSETPRGPDIMRETATVTNPTLVPNGFGGSDSGIGGSDGDVVAIVSGGVQAWTCDNAGGVTCYMPAVASPPTCDTVGEVYHDDTGTYCICDGAGTWSVITGMNYSGTGSCSA